MFRFRRKGFWKNLGQVKKADSGIVASILQSLHVYSK
jgi:hypothetical protein